MLMKKLFIITQGHTFHFLGSLFIEILFPLGAIFWEFFHFLGIDRIYSHQIYFLCLIYSLLGLTVKVDVEVFWLFILSSIIFGVSYLSVPKSNIAMPPGEVVVLEFIFIPIIFSIGMDRYHKHYQNHTPFFGV